MELINAISAAYEAAIVIGVVAAVAVAALVAIVVVVVVVAQLHWALIGRARWQAELEAERYAEELAAVRLQAQRDETAREQDVIAAYRAREAARHQAWAAEQVNALRNKAVVAIRWRNGLLASKEAMTARQYSDWSHEVKCAQMAVKAAIAKLNQFPTNDNWRGSDVDESWLCQNFGPRV